MALSRRHFLGAAAFVSAAVALDAVLIEPHLIRSTIYDLPTVKWPADQPPLKIVMASDFHVGCPAVSYESLELLVTRMNAVGADMICLPGDFLTNDRRIVIHKDDPADIARILAALKAPLGVYAVMGNHDWKAKGTAAEGHRLWKQMESRGIAVLENDALKIKTPRHDFWLAGLADDTTRRPSLTKTYNHVTDSRPVIMMTHDPATFLEKDDRPVVTLAGHTHGGQVVLPFAGVIHIPGRAPKRYAYGHIVESGRDLIVTSGIGESGLPVRFRAPPEIVTLTLRSAPPKP